MGGVVVYLLIVSAAYVAAMLHVLQSPVTILSEGFQVGVTCMLVGGIGGCVYCLRAVYLNYSVRKQWSSEWVIWYLLRPLVSAACGAISFVFLRAGLLVLEAGPKADASELGFYALAFIAGLNVDKFISKIEDIAQAVWGIEKSRASKGTDDK